MKLTIFNRDYSRGVKVNFPLLVILLLPWTCIHGQSGEWTNYSNADHFSAMMETGNDLWIGTNGGGLIQINHLSGDTTYHTAANSGLPQNRITCLTMGKDEILWVGTHAGLVSYDGMVWNIHHTETFEAPSNRIETMTVDSSGILWMGAQQELFSFDGSQWLAYDENNSSLDGSANITCVSAGPDGMLWVGTENNNGGLHRFDGQAWAHYTESNSGLPNDYIETLEVDQSGTVWILPHSGHLVSFDGTEWETYDETDCEAIGSGIKGIAISPDNELWVGTNSGLLQFNGTGWTVYDTTNSGLPSQAIGIVTFDPHGNLLLYYEEGLGYWDWVTWSALTFRRSPLPYPHVQSIEIDKNNHAWVACGGLSSFDGEKWITWEADDPDIPISATRLICVDSSGTKWLYWETGGIMSPTYGGLFTFNDSTWVVYDETNSPFYFGDTVIRTIIHEGGSVMWFLTDWNLVKFDGTDWTTYGPKNSGIPSYAILRSMVIDHEGIMWIGTDSGELIKFDGLEWTVFSHSNSTMPFDLSYILPQAVGKDGLVWSLADSGMISFDGSKWQRYTPLNSGLPNSHISSIACDEKGILWLSSFSTNGWFDVNASCLVSYDGFRWFEYNSSNSSFPTEWVSDIEIDSSGNIWIATMGSGVFVFNPEYSMTGFKEDESTPVQPTAFHMNQNYPNPFNPNTTITYSIPEMTDVSMTIYDVRGRTVLTHSELQKHTGKYEFTWNGVDEVGLGVPTGVYFARLTAGEFSHTIKMLFLK